jgi:hypothetical protein
VRYAVPSVARGKMLHRIYEIRHCSMSRLCGSKRMETAPAEEHKIIDRSASQLAQFYALHRMIRAFFQDEIGALAGG